ncbi:VanZ family protein [Streptomyces sp. EAS-AB2608]|uniref:VanZ family protein n=1 Tax=Streptomyces sp. EAS-AB2608 TaxID=2779671 RepID=UPI001C84BCF9
MSVAERDRGIAAVGAEGATLRTYSIPRASASRGTPVWQVVLYVSPASCLAAAVLAVLLCFLAEFITARRPDIIRPLSGSLLAVWVLLVLAVTVIPDGPPAGRFDQIYWLPGEGLIYGTAGMGSNEISMILKQEAANAIMFAPIAILAYYALRNPSRLLVLAGCAAFSCAIELIQWLEQAGRTADVDDLTFNSLGAAFGLAAVTIASIAMTRRNLHARA